MLFLYTSLRITLHQPVDKGIHKLAQVAQLCWSD